MFTWLIKLILIVSVVRAYRNSYVNLDQISYEDGLPENLSIGKGQDIFLFWKPSDKPLTKCTLNPPSDQYIDLLKGTQGNYVVSKTQPFNLGYCCVTIKNMGQENGNGSYFLEASDGDNNYNAGTRVTIADPPLIQNKALIVEEGGGGSINCGGDPSTFCTLTSPRGKVETFGGPCVKHFSGATYVEYHGTWNCSYILPGYVMPFFSSVSIQVVAEDTREVFIKEFEHEVAFYCSSLPKYKLVRSCKITRPAGDSLFVNPGMAYGRYTYYGKAGVCGVTIPKPLHPDDIGQWGCQLVVDMRGSPDIYGGYLHVGSGSTKISNAHVSIDKFYVTSSYEPPTLVCHVPHNIEYCWFRSPNGTIFQVKDQYLIEAIDYVDESSFYITSLGFKFGDCAFALSDIKDIKKYKNTGNWTCHVGMIKDAVYEATASIKVLYSDIPIMQHEESVSAKLGDSAQVGCFTVAGVGLKYCRFVRPDGTSINPTKNGSDYSYAGKGLLHGDCGVKIHSLRDEDIGTWRCTTKSISGTPDTEYSTNIEVQKKSPNLLWVYIVTGVVTLSIIAALIFLANRRYELKIKRRRLEEDSLELVENEEVQKSTTSITQRLNAALDLVRRRSSVRPSAPPRGFIETPGPSRRRTCSLSDTPQTVNHFETPGSTDI